MFETIVEAGTSLYEAMNAVFNALMYVGESEVGFYDVIANGEFNVSFIRLILGFITGAGTSILFAFIKRIFGTVASSSGS